MVASRALEASGGGASDSEEDEPAVVVPYAAENDEPNAPTALIEVPLLLQLRADGSADFGLVLDEHNVVVSLRAGRPAWGKMVVGDRIVGVDGVPCVAPQRISQLLRETPPRSATSRTFIVQRAAPPPHSHLTVMAAAKADHVDVSDADDAALADNDNAAGASLLPPKSWGRDARAELARRVSAAEMLREEGNDKFRVGEYGAALNEYRYALQLFAGDLGELCDHQRREEVLQLGPDDALTIQRARVPCLLNAAACNVKLGGTKRLLEALDCCREVLMAAPAAAEAAKAHFRIGQAQLALGNPREAKAALLKAQELSPSSREVRDLLLKLPHELEQLKAAERESREGLMATPQNEEQLSRIGRADAASKLAMLRRLLPKGVEQPQKADALLERVASKGWRNASGEDQAVLSGWWLSARARLSADEIRDGRAAGVYPALDEERILGNNLPHALVAKPFTDKKLTWLLPEQKQKAHHLAKLIWKKGVESLDGDERRLCEGLQLLAMTPHTTQWHRRPIGSKGGAQLILAESRRRLWPSVPTTLRVQEAVLGARMPAVERAQINGWSRRAMSPGEIGIIKSNEGCWRHALAQGWEYTLVLEDDAKVDLDGGPLQLLAMLPELVAAAAYYEPKWQLLALTPHGLEPFYALCDPSHVPSLHRLGAATPRWAMSPEPIGASGWKRIGPTFHAFGWVYRAPLMRKLVESLQAQAPPLNPVDVWVWEVMALNGMLGAALAPTTPLVLTSETPGSSTSIRTQQNDGHLV